MIVPQGLRFCQVSRQADCRVRPGSDADTEAEAVSEAAVRYLMAEPESFRVSVLRVSDVLASPAGMSCNLSHWAYIPAGQDATAALVVLEADMEEFWAEWGGTFRSHAETLVLEAGEEQPQD